MKNIHTHTNTWGRRNESNYLPPRQRQRGSATDRKGWLDLWWRWRRRDPTGSVTLDASDFHWTAPSTQRQTKERFSVTELTKKQKTKKKHCAKWERRRPSQLLWEILELKMALIKTRVLLSRAQKCFFLAVCLPRLGTAPFFRCFSFESPFHRGSERLGGCVDLIN